MTTLKIRYRRNGWPAHARMRVYVHRVGWKNTETITGSKSMRVSSNSGLKVAQRGKDRSRETDGQNSIVDFR